MSSQPQRQGRLIIFVGPAGAGKTTLAHRLIGADRGRRGFSVSHTTRAIRPTEQNGSDYHFVTRAQFEAHLADDAFLEWALVHDNYYGTSRAEVDRHLAAGRDIFFDIDIQGAINVHGQLGDQALLVFIVPPSWQVLVARLEGRGSETDKTLRRRLRTARTELRGLSKSPLPWHLIVNDALDVAEQDLETLLTAQKPSPADFSDLIASLCADADADERAADPT